MLLDDQSDEMTSELRSTKQVAIATASERQHLLKKLQTLDEELRRMLRTGPKVPRMSRDAMEEAIKDLEFKRSTTSMSLQVGEEGWGAVKRD